MTIRTITPTELPDDRAQFDHGDCGAFAKALCEASGSREIWVISAANGEPWSDDLDFETTHIVVEHPEWPLYGDASGWSDSSEIALRFGLDARWHEYELVGPYDVAQLDSLFGCDEGPLDIDEQSVHEARQIIAEDTRFGLTMRSWGPLVLPLVHKRELYHVGTLDPAAKRQGSMEGSGLSVSEHPDAWRSIGRGSVSGATWRLTGGGAFIDAHALDPGQRKAIADWGVREGLVVPVQLWESAWFDDELDAEMTAFFESREEAESKAGEGLDVKAVDGYAATAALEARQGGCQRIPYALVFDHLLAELSSRVPGLSGVWWDDTLDVARYSAPRGVIQLDSVPQWQREDLSHPRAERVANGARPLVMSSPR